MKPKAVAITSAGALLLGMLLIGTPSIAAQARQGRLVRIAELEIDPGQLDAYKDALREEIEASIRIEPGVLSLYAVSVKDQPNQIRLFEVYAGTEAGSREIGTRAAIDLRMTPSRKRCTRMHRSMTRES